MMLTEREILQKSVLVVTDSVYVPIKFGFFYSGSKAKRLNQPEAQCVEKWTYSRTGVVQRTPGASAEIECVPVDGIVEGVKHTFLYALCGDSHGDMNVEVIWNIATDWIADIHRPNVVKFVMPFLEQLTTRIAALYIREERAQICTSSSRVTYSEGVHKRCDYCNKPLVVVKRCARCQKVSYCDRECQRMHWKDHKKVCSEC